MDVLVVLSRSRSRSSATGENGEDTAGVAVAAGLLAVAGVLGVSGTKGLLDDGEGDGIPCACAAWESIDGPRKDAEDGDEETVADLKGWMELIDGRRPWDGVGTRAASL